MPDSDFLCRSDTETRRRRGIKGISVSACLMMPRRNFYFINIRHLVQVDNNLPPALVLTGDYQPAHHQWRIRSPAELTEDSSYEHSCSTVSWNVLFTYGDQMIDHARVTWITEYGNEKGPAGKSGRSRRPLHHLFQKLQNARGLSSSPTEERSASNALPSGTDHHPRRVCPNGLKQPCSACYSWLSREVRIPRMRTSSTAV